MAGLTRESKNMKNWCRNLFQSSFWIHATTLSAGALSDWKCSSNVRFQSHTQCSHTSVVAMCSDRSFQCFLPVLQCPQSMLVSLSTHSSFLLMPHFNHQHFSMHSDHFMWLTSMVTAESEFSLQFIFYMLSVFQTARSLQAFGLRLREYMNEMFSPKQHLSLSTFTFNGKLFCNKPPDWLSSLPVCSI